ncbi:MAG: polysaccharide pyruvyl transferase family protein [Mediterraneibacter sp.]
MKIGIMTMQRIRNYGSYLQAYGLKKIVESLGHQVVFVDYRMEVPVSEKGALKEKKVYRILRKICRKAKIGKNKILRMLKPEERKGFESFISAFENQYIRDLGVPKKRQYETKTEVLIIGSDEVFNCTQGEGVGFSRELFGAGSNAEKVISYAASFGNTTLEKLKKYHIDEEIGKLLNNFSAISVRDRNSRDIVSRLTGKSCELHLDPVLVYNFEHDIKDTVKERNYILIYAYNKRITEEEGQIIREFAVSHNKKLIALSGEQSFCDEYIYCHPLEMLSYFKHADYVITDTFHGTIFSVINHRQFATLVRKDEEAKGYGNQEKLGYLLEELELESQRAENLYHLDEILNHTIAYDKVDEIIERERSHTMEYLKTNLC